MKKRLKETKAGEPISAHELNERLGIAEWFSRLTVAPPLQLKTGAGGPILSLKERNHFWIRITGQSGSAYSWEKVLPMAGGAWQTADLTGSFTTFPAYETGGRSVPIGRIVRGFVNESAAYEIRFTYASV